ncbi:MAG: tetratricopeptide repeat protein [Hahellaceae bacterium]|jgi:CheY-like chemotaxis protein/thioredoxin-like negative regulator of GroEL|nr:tetratricopeptide repeat protein [Hahellaceae bacterium]
MISREYRNTRFLIVDSQLESRLLLERKLKALGAWYIDVAVDGQHAIDRCGKGLFDVVICEYALEGRNGQHVLEELRERALLRFTSLFIMMSAETTREMVLGAIDHQPDAYISKPIVENVLQQRLDALLIDNESLYDIRHAMDMKRTSEAINRCEEKIRKGSKYLRWCEKTVAELYLQTKAYPEALRVYKQVLNEKPLVWAQLGIARVYLALAEYEQAETFLKQVIKTAPNCLHAYDLMADLLVETGRAVEAQAVLTDAVNRSPAAIRRHARLGDLSMHNQDVETATEAFRNAVEMGSHSVFNRPENHIGYARALTEKSESAPKELRDDLARDALSVLEKMASSLEGGDLIHFQRSVIDAKLHHRLQNEPEEAASLAKAEGLYQRIGLELKSEKALEYAEALLGAGKDTQAEFILAQVSLLHAGDEKVMQRVAQIREEPVSAGARQRAAELNKEGIKLVESGDFAGAIRVFTDALDYSPRHPALNLNLVQVIVKSMENRQTDEQSLNLAKQCLGRLGNLPESHRQYARYHHLKQKLGIL